MYPSGDDYGLYLAQLVQTYYKRNAGVTLNIIDDSSKTVSKEILIGNTNRYQTSLTEREYAVTLKGFKVVFEGGHSATVEKAVKEFIAADYSPLKLNEFSGTAYDLELTRSLDNEEYTYVWGDEFDGNALDTTKFSYKHTFGLGYQGGTYTEYPVRNTDYAKIEDGMLKMTAVMDSSGNVKNAASICTADNMWFLHGYLEMRAKIPLKHGAWPAWWATDYCGDSTPFDISERKYLIEVDFFEAFNATGGLIESNVHKWYRNSDIKNIEAAGIKNSFLHPIDSKGNEVEHSSKRTDSLYGNNIISEKESYHIFGFHWTEDKMAMYVDGKMYAYYDLNDENSIDSYSDNSGFKNNPMHMVFNNWLLLKGCFGESASGNNAVYEDFPIEYDIDYVRLYQTNGDNLYNIGLN